MTTGRQYGKTTEGGVAALQALLAAPDQFGAPTVGIVADTYEHANLLWDRVTAHLFSTPQLRGLIDTSRPGKGYDRERWIVYLKGGATIQKFSADSPQSLAGHTLSACIIDEKAFVSDEAIEHLMPCLSLRQGVVVAFGTAEGTGWSRVWHFRGLDSEYPQYATISHPSTDNPFMPLEEFELARLTLPDRRFRQLWLAEWVSDAGAVFHNIEGCAVPGWPERQPFEAGHRYIMGVDLARYSDYTAWIVADMETRRCVARGRFNDEDWSRQAGRLAAVAKEYGGARVWVDATHGSAGDVLVEALKKQYGLDVWGYQITAASKGALIDKLVWALEREELRFPDCWQDVKNELVLYTADVRPSGHVAFAAQHGHDDYVIALALLNHGMRAALPVVRRVPRTVGAWEGW